MLLSMVAGFVPYLLLIFCPLQTNTEYCCDMSKMDAAQADFALNLLRVTSEGDTKHKSAIMSPFSIATALAMTYVGAQGETRSQMDRVLAAGSSNDEFNQYFRKLLQELSQTDPGYQLSSANKIFIREGFDVKRVYSDVIKTVFGGQLGRIDVSKPREVADEINRWVENETNSKIKDLVQPNAISPATAMLLVNAVYFKATWSLQFRKMLTAEKTFHEQGGSTRKVQMMSNEKFYPYFANDKVQVLGMPYESNQVYMYVFLPKDINGLEALEKSIDGQQIFEMITKTTQQNVQVEIPKFKLEDDYKLADSLKKLGMADAFSGSANFSGISDSSLSISEVIHKAMIAVDEQGTEAAAATVVMMLGSSMQITEPIRFIADHPFMFAIVKDKTILFIGHLH